MGQKEIQTVSLGEEKSSRKLKLSPKTCAKEKASIVQETRARFLFPSSILEWKGYPHLVKPTTCKRELKEFSVLMWRITGMRRVHSKFVVECGSVVYILLTLETSMRGH